MFSSSRVSTNSNMDDDFFSSIMPMFGLPHKSTLFENKNEDEKNLKNGSEHKNPFGHFEVIVNGKKVTNPKEIEKDRHMFDDMFDGFDFGFNPLNVAKDIHHMNRRI